MATVVAVLVVLVAPGCAEDAPAGPTQEAPAAPDLSDASLWLSFEEQGLTYEGGTEFPDALGGPFSGLVVTANGGTVEAVAGVDGRGDALAFPAKCDDTTGCPRAMVEVAADPALDPGTDDFEFGAAVWLAPDQTTEGSNLVQRGRFDTDGGLWKLQVDSLEGRPSCVVRAAGGEPVVVRSSVSVADSAWHRVSCRRDATGIEIDVDGTVDREEGATGSVVSDWPLRVGSPGVGDEDDQFHGRIDDVFLRTSPST
jgi:Concanavalin A-like lectin/glucanases superfamily